jgi:hypothetical protein
MLLSCKYDTRDESPSDWNCEIRTSDTDLQFGEGSDSSLQKFIQPHDIQFDPDAPPRPTSTPTIACGRGPQDPDSISHN